MEAVLLAQYVIVGLAVVASALYVLHRQWPGAARWLRGRLALWLLRDVRAPWIRRVGRLLAPVPARADAMCGSACSGCGPRARL